MKRALMPYGGIRMAKGALEAYGFKIDPETDFVFEKLSKTHNQGVFDAYTSEIMKARHNKIITGLPDAYGRGRLIGELHLVVLYVFDRLIYKQNKFLDIVRYGLIQHYIS